MVYLETWADFETQSKALYLGAPSKVRGQCWEGMDGASLVGVAKRPHDRWLHIGVVALAPPHAAQVRHTVKYDRSGTTLIVKVTDDRVVSGATDPASELWCWLGTPVTPRRAALLSASSTGRTKKWTCDEWASWCSGLQNR